MSGYDPKFWEINVEPQILEELHLLGHARYVERATMDRQRIVPLADVADDRAPYFSMIIAHRRGTAVTP